MGGQPAQPEMTGESFNDAVRKAGWTFIGTAAFPKLARRLRWPMRLGPRGLLLYVAFNTALGLAVRTWAVPWFKRLGERREQAKNDLRQQLGREPTDEEFGAHLFARHTAEHGG